VNFGLGPGCQWLSIPRPANVSHPQFALDTGADLIYLPTPIANFLASKYSPPAAPHLEYEEGGNYPIPCNAKPPGFAFKINGTIFPVDKRDMIYEVDGKCFAGIADGFNDPSSAPWVAGDVFLRNVVAQFDLGKLEMRFASRSDLFLFY